jgi:DNA repair protein RadD
MEALDAHLCSKTTNPCVVLPTGSGKSLVMAWLIQRWKADFPPLRVCVLAHRKELVRQNADELIGLLPGGDIGIYAASMRRRDSEHSILFGSIDSIWNRWGEFAPWDVLIVDEAHRIPASGEGKYREFIRGSRLTSKNLRVVGFTATPYRMGCGPICHKDHILHEVCYEANVGDLIAQGYLCRLRSKIGDTQPDLEKVRRNHGGDYVTNSLAEAVGGVDVVAKAVHSAMQIIIREKRQACIFFCVDEEHCRRVSAELIKFGLHAPTVTAKTPHQERDRIVAAFKSGQIRGLCNINVYTEGFNATRVDCVVLLCPTLSRGRYSQMVGRGLRLHPGKEDCLVLDYARCIEEHGPIDCLDAGQVILATCGQCGDAFSRAIRFCPHCGWEIPKQEIERAAAEERERTLHEATHSNRNILGSEPEILDVSEVTVHRHRKPGSPDSLRVQYRCGISTFREWVCLDHGGYAETKARRWWWARFGRGEAETITVNKALEDMLIGHRIESVTRTITVVRRGKYSEIVGYGLKPEGA